MEYVGQIQAQLQDVAVAVPWDKDVFKPGNYILDDLFQELDRSDFAVLLYAPEGAGRYRKQDVLIANQNVIFEHGLFTGRLGKERALLVRPKDAELLVPSDLGGISHIEYVHRPEEPAAAMGPVTLKLKSALRTLGPREGKKPAPVTVRTDGGEGPLLRVREFRKLGRVEANGDLTFKESFIDVSCTGDSLARWPWTLHSESGKPDEPVLTSHTKGRKVRWEWRKGVQKGPNYEGNIVFAPALRSGDVMSFEASRTMHNAVYFSRRDAMAAGNSDPGREWVSHKVRQLHDLLVLQLFFPANRYPVKAGPFVQAAGSVDADELARVQGGFIAADLGYSMTLTVQAPKPGRMYGIEWSLPQEDDLVPRFAPDLMSCMEELTRRMLYSSDNKECPVREVGPALNALAKEILKEPGFARVPAKAIEVSLFLYDRLESALRCVGVSPAPAAWDTLAGLRLRPGRGLAGRAFRTRADVLYANIRSRPKQNVQLFELDQTQKQAPETVIWCHPVKLEMDAGRSVAIVAVKAVSAPTDVLDAVKGTGTAEILGRLVDRWFAGLLRKYAALNSAEFWNRVDVVQRRTGAAQTR